MNLDIFDYKMVNKLRLVGIPLLRISIGVVFLWFGLLKIFGVSPVVELVSNAYPFFSESVFVIVLGCWEAAIGLGLIFKTSLRLVILALWIQMAGVFGSLVSTPSVFFQFGNPFLLTFEGEFIVKNIVIIAASLVVGGYEVSQDEPAQQ
ncbi:MAG: hypothetical protein Q7S43_01630 [bacterium]|nr:hypothetical protein [bacterium]